MTIVCVTRVYMYVCLCVYIETAGASKMCVCESKRVRITRSKETKSIRSNDVDEGRPYYILRPEFRSPLLSFSTHLATLLRPPLPYNLRFHTKCRVKREPCVSQ